MRITHEAISSDIIDLELIELKFVFDRCMIHLLLQLTILVDFVSVHHDNRDFEILPNYQPKNVEDFNTQTLLFGKSEGVSALQIVFRR